MLALLFGVCAALSAAAFFRSIHRDQAPSGLAIAAYLASAVLFVSTF